MANRIQIRRGTAAYWTAANPVLSSGEPGFETDSRKLKIGDGQTRWQELAYSPIDSGVVLPPELPEDQATLAEHINALEPHPIYDDGPSLTLLYQNAKV